MNKSDKRVLYALYELTHGCPYTREEDPDKVRGYAVRTVTIEEISQNISLKSEEIRQILNKYVCIHPYAIIYQVKENYCLTERGIVIIERAQDIDLKEKMQKQILLYSICGVILGAVIGAIISHPEWLVKLFEWLL